MYLRGIRPTRPTIAIGDNSNVPSALKTFGERNLKDILEYSPDRESFIFSLKQSVAEFKKDAEAVFGPDQLNAKLVDFICSSPSDWHNYFANLFDAFTDDGYRNVTTCPFFMLVMALCRSQVLYGTAVTGEAVRDNTRIAIMGLFPPIDHHTTVMDIMSQRYTSPVGEDCFEWFQTIPVALPSKSGIYGGRNSDIMKEYASAREQQLREQHIRSKSDKSVHCETPTSLGKVAALTFECASWNRKYNCVDTPKASFNPVNWTDTVGNRGPITLFEALVGTSIYQSAKSQNLAKRDKLTSDFMQYVSDNVQLFVPGIPGAFSLKCAKTNGIKRLCSALGTFNVLSDSDYSCQPEAQLCGSASKAAKQISSWIQLAAEPAKLSPANKIALYNQLLADIPYGITGATRAICGNVRDKTTVIDRASDEAVYDAEDQSISRSYELISDDKRCDVFVRVDLALGLTTYCIESNTNERRRNNFISAIENILQNLAEADDNNAPNSEAHKDLTKQYNNLVAKQANALTKPFVPQCN